MFHAIPRKGEVGYETWLTAGQAEKSGNTGVWAPMSADEALGLVYVGVELPPTDILGVSRQGPSLFSETLVALDIETGQRKWHYQLEHHGLWDRDVPAAGILCDIPVGGKIVKAIAQLSKQGFLYVLDRLNRKADLADSGRSPRRRAMYPALNGTRPPNRVPPSRRHSTSRHSPRTISSTGRPRSRQGRWKSPAITG